MNSNDSRRRHHLRDNNNHHATRFACTLSIMTLLKIMSVSYMCLIFVVWISSPLMQNALQQTPISLSDLNLSEGRKLKTQSTWSSYWKPIINTAPQSLEQDKQQQRVQSPEQHNHLDNFLPRVLAIIFPQFHSDPLNNRLWGEGFSDWNSLQQSTSHNRLGYSIPRLTELGYYNYTDTKPRKKQGELARQYGIDGFIYHHYWFYDPKHPGPVLHAPLMGMLQDGHPNLPFALHWCASKWTNTWSGAVSKDFVFEQPGVLQRQYFPSDNDTAIQEHYQWLRQFFHHPNYIKVDGGKPLFMIYQKKPGSFPVLNRLQQLAKEDGFPDLYLTVGLTMPHQHLMKLDPAQTYDPPPQVFSKIVQDHFQRPLAYPNPATFNINRTLEIPKWCLDASLQNQPRVADIVGIISSFDNTPRRTFEEAHIWSPGEPSVVINRFRKSLQAALYYEACCFPDEKRLNNKRDDDDRFVVINAMNEWAEGMALEPSDVYGRSFLEAIYTSKQQVRASQCRAQALAS